jgi:hypothetical protein
MFAAGGLSFVILINDGCHFEETRRGALGLAGDILAFVETLGLEDMSSASSPTEKLEQF